MQFEPKQLEVAKRLTICASIYQNAFLNDPCFKNQFSNNYVALACFLENYAYERQGAAPAYPVIAKLTIEEVFQGKLESVTLAHAKEAWQRYKEIATKGFNNLKVNEGHNPMNLERGVLATMTKHQIPNIANHIKILIEQGKTEGAHKFASSIRGIGTKIASFYIRDIAYLSGIAENRIKDQFYLQPMDTWLEQTLSIMLGSAVPKSLQDKQKAIIELCSFAGCSPIAFNQGAWVLGSQIAGDFNTFKKIALGENARTILERHISEKKAYISEVEKIIDKIS